MSHISWGSYDKGFYDNLKINNTHVNLVLLKKIEIIILKSKAVYEQTSALKFAK